MDRDGTWGVPLWIRVALVAVAVAVLGLRLADRDLIPYILDEPKFQDSGELGARTGTWPPLSPVIASLGVPYGPGPVWFYVVVHRVVGPRPELSALAATLFLSLSQLALAAALARALRGGVVLFASITVLLAGSPFLFFWSRLAWDVLAGYTAVALALLAVARPLPAWRGALVGVLLGLALASHPMTVPLVIAILCVLSWEALQRRSAAGLVALLAAMVLINVPYLEALQHAPQHPRLPGGSGLAERLAAAPGRLWSELLEPARVLTTTGVDYFFDGAWVSFRSTLGIGAALLSTGPVLAMLLAVLGLAGLAWTARFGAPTARRIARIGALTWIGHALLFTVLGLVVQPHYQLATWWLVPAGIGGLAMALLPGRVQLARGLLVLVWTVALAQVGFSQAWMRWIRAAGGTTGIHYSVPLSAQRAVVREACSTDRPNVALANRTALFPVSLLSVARSEPSCTGKRVGICPGDCPPLDATWRVVSLRYLAPPGGRLAPVARE
jgi:hypothetical protein